jgi:hypothetical protein
MPTYHGTAAAAAPAISTSIPRLVASFFIGILLDDRRAVGPLVGGG